MGNSYHLVIGSIELLRCIQIRNLTDLYNATLGCFNNFKWHFQLIYIYLASLQRLDVTILAPRWSYWLMYDKLKRMAGGVGTETRSCGLCSILLQRILWIENGNLVQMKKEFFVPEMIIPMYSMFVMDTLHFQLTVPKLNWSCTQLCSHCIFMILMCFPDPHAIELTTMGLYDWLVHVNCLHCLVVNKYPN